MSFILSFPSCLQFIFLHALDVSLVVLKYTEIFLQENKLYSFHFPASYIIIDISHMNILTTNGLDIAYMHSFSL